MLDPINPDYYKRLKIEVIEFVAEVVDGLKGIEAVCIGNIFKYLIRYPYKNQLEDLKKAFWYLEYLIKYKSSDETQKKKVEELIREQQFDEFHDEE
jgi:hypothetical protein